jgi:hypothetical protein
VRDNAILPPTASGDGAGEPFCAPLPPTHLVSQGWALRQHSFKALFPPVPMALSPRLRCTSSRHCPCTPASLSAPADPKFCWSLRSRCASAGHCALRQAGVSFPPTTSLTLFDVILSMIILPAAQVLHQSEWLPVLQKRRQESATLVRLPILWSDEWLLASILSRLLAAVRHAQVYLGRPYYGTGLVPFS